MKHLPYCACGLAAVHNIRLHEFDPFIVISYVEVFHHKSYAVVIQTKMFWFVLQRLLHRLVNFPTVAKKSSDIFLIQPIEILRLGSICFEEIVELKQRHSTH